ncbi:hypothetical protein NBO_4g0016 [Nosema bombycis CQ1]|uniref:Uncharacterized protein n=1 Tax=Nosema bombycis (strain CQ1 / CVCC 102059) TaxID=578461 RepID=R0MR88_NOSB1|nr:hypothetical protein NBO_4g0016 [Nosema bombycis CQ1]|eukprot:EOB15388.1 hypothetical protein NBO_4g0016 [Nosema bombycis CQ1]
MSKYFLTYKLLFFILLQPIPSFVFMPFMRHKDNANKQQKSFNTKDYEQYINPQPFIIYAVSSIILLIGSLIVNMKLFLYGLIPLSFSNFIGAHGDEKMILFCLNVSYAVTLLFFKHEIKLFR